MSVSRAISELDSQRGNGDDVAPVPPACPKVLRFSTGKRGDDSLIQIRVDESEPIEKALKRFKKECQKSGILTEVRRREFYEKPSVKRKRAQEAAVRKYRRRMQKVQAKLEMM